MGALHGERIVSIAPYLLGKPFDPETVSLMTRTFDAVCAELGLKLQTQLLKPLQSRSLNSSNAA